MSNGDESSEFGHAVEDKGISPYEKGTLRAPFLLAKASKKKQVDKKKKPAPASGKTIILWASGFPGYNSDAEEIDAINNSTKTNKWEPHSLDFAATAMSSTGEAHNVAKCEDVIAQLQNVNGKIGRIVLIGHGDQNGTIGLSGTRTGMGISMTEEFDETCLDTYKNEIMQLNLDKNATIDIVACNVAVDRKFMQKIANTFNHGVRGFSGLVYWQHPINDEGTQIINRGFVSRSNNDFHKGINKLIFPKPIDPERQEE